MTTDEFFKLRDKFEERVWNNFRRCYTGASVEMEQYLAIQKEATNQLVVFLAYNELEVEE